MKRKELRKIESKKEEQKYSISVYINRNLSINIIHGYTQGQKLGLCHKNIELYSI